jgi:hypothetical protein
MGWMQTLIVHDRHWRSLLHDLGWQGFIGLHIYVGSMIFSAPLHTAFLLSFLVSAVTLHLPESFSWSAMLTLGIFILGYLGPVLLVIAGLDRLRRLDLLAAQLLLPFYWLLHGVAMLMAAWELVVSPFAWSKTAHGKTRVKRGAVRPSEVQAE